MKGGAVRAKQLSSDVLLQGHWPLLLEMFTSKGYESHYKQLNGCRLFPSTYYWNFNKTLPEAKSINIEAQDNIGSAGKMDYIAGCSKWEHIIITEK